LKFLKEITLSALALMAKMILARLRSNSELLDGTLTNFHRGSIYEAIGIPSYISLDYPTTMETAVSLKQTIA
jgi:hypothetical protein